MITRFLHPPLYSAAYDQAFGTVYTAIYRPEEQCVEYRWPQDRWLRSFDSPEEVKTVTLGSPGAPDGSPADSSSADTPDAALAAELGAQARQAILQLSQLPDQAAFGELLGLSEAVGVALGESARILAEHGSWSTVAGVAGVSRQAAWYRWRE